MEARANANSRSGKQCRERYLIISCFLDGTTTWTPLFLKNPGRYKNRKQCLKRIKNTATNGLILLTNSKEGTFLKYFRTDSDVKNHFYSIIRKCLRRVSKMVGQKNST